MRSALIHGVLLAVMLVYGYRTWTRDKTIKPDLGAVVLWNKGESELASIELKSEKKTVTLERRGEGASGYWWGKETVVEKKPKPADKTADAAGSGSGSGSAAGSGSGSGSAAGSGSGSGSAAPAPALVETKKTTEFPLGDGGTKLLAGYTQARALRDLGTPSDAAKKEYKLDTPATQATLTVGFKDGSKREFQVGGSVFNTGGSGDRYAIDKASGKGYVLSKELIGALEIGQSQLHLTDPRGFDVAKVEAVAIESGGRTKRAARMQTGVEGTKVKTWGDAATKKSDQTLANFIDNAGNLKPTEYRPDLKVESLTPVMKLVYADASGGALGSLTLYKGEQAPQVAPDAEIDPANPPRGEVEYYVMSEKTRVPGLVRKDTAQRAEQDLPIVFGDKPPPPPPTKPLPKDSPFKTTPIAPSPGAAGSAGSAAAAPVAPSPGAPVPPHGADPHVAPPAGSAAPPAAGSAAPPAASHDGHAH